MERSIVLTFENSGGDAPRDGSNPGSGAARSNRLGSDSGPSDREFRSLLISLRPRIRGRLRALIRARCVRNGTTFRDVDVDDMVQEVLAALLQKGPAAVSWWDPVKGGSREHSVLLFAERAAKSFLRSGRRSGWAEVCTSDSTLEATEGPGLERELLARRALESIARELRGRFGVRGVRILEAWIGGGTAMELCAELELTPNGLYCLRRRLRMAARASIGT